MPSNQTMVRPRFGSINLKRYELRITQTNAGLANCAASPLSDHMPKRSHRRSKSRIPIEAVIIGVLVVLSYVNAIFIWL